MKKLLSVLLALSMVLAPINSRISFADETELNGTVLNETEINKTVLNGTELNGTELNETSDGEVSDLLKINEPSLYKRLWQGVKSGTIKATEIATEIALFIYDLAVEVATDPQFDVITTLWATTIFAVFELNNRFNNNA